MSETYLRELVGWTVQDAPRGVAIGRRLAAVAHAVSTVVTLGADATSGARPPTWSVPADPDAFLDLGVLRLRGHSSWLPGNGTTALPVAATRRDVWLTPPHADRPSCRVPVETLRISAAAPARASRNARYPTAPWTLTLTDGTDQVRLDGAWLGLAWIGHLAGWPEPRPGS